MLFCFSNLILASGNSVCRISYLTIRKPCVKPILLPFHAELSSAIEIKFMPLASCEATADYKDFGGSSGAGNRWRMYFGAASGKRDFIIGVLCTGIGNEKDY